MFHRLLVLLDTTPGGRLALEYGVALARQAGAELHLLAVTPLPSVPGEIDELRELEENGRAALTPIVRAAREYAEGRGQPVTTEIPIGPPADTRACSIQGPRSSKARRRQIRPRQICRASSGSI
jgi:nucleotide-binding universal stress UspA family protein